MSPLDDRNERRWHDIEALADWIESNVRHMRRQMEHTRYLLDHDAAAIPPSQLSENLKKAVSELEQAQKQTVYASNNISRVVLWKIPDSVREDSKDSADEP